MVQHIFKLTFTFTRVEANTQQWIYKSILWAVVQTKSVFHEYRDGE